MRYDHGTEQAVLVSRDQATGQPAADGPDGVVLILATLIVLLALGLCCRPSGHHTPGRDSRSGTHQNH
jgi:hypothetical protein